VTKQRKAELQAKGAIVAWTCQDIYGMCHLLYLKARNGRFTLIRQTEGLRDEQIAPVGEGYYRLDKKHKVSFLIGCFTRQIKIWAVSVSRPIYLTNIEKVKVLPRLPRKALKEVK